MSAHKPCKVTLFSLETQFFLADSKKYQADNKNYLPESKKMEGESLRFYIGAAGAAGLQNAPFLEVQEDALFQQLLHLFLQFAGLFAGYLCKVLGRIGVDDAA